MDKELIVPEVEGALPPMTVTQVDPLPVEVGTHTDPHVVHNNVLTRETYTATKKEMAILMADPDPATIQTLRGAIYIPHIHYRVRLTDAFGGRWALVPLCEPGKPFIATELPSGATELSVHYALTVDDKFVGDAWGSGTYHPSNGMQNYGDVLEGARSDCLSRVGKDKLVFWKLWDKQYQADYKAGRLEGQSDPDDSEMERPVHRPAPQQASSAPPVPHQEPPRGGFKDKTSGATSGVVDSFRPHNYEKYGKHKTMYFFTVSGQDYTAFSADIGHQIEIAYTNKLQVLDVEFEMGSGEHSKKRTAKSVEIAEPAEM